METNNYGELLEKYRLGTCSDAELLKLDAWYADWHAEDRVTLSEEELNRAEELMRAEVMSRITVKTMVPWRKLSAAASILMLLGSGLYYFSRNKPATQRTYTQLKAERIAPGKQGATLTLANGKKIKLSDVKNGLLAKQAGITVSKSSNGQLVYELKAGEEKNSGEAAEGINTLATAKGETYQLRLPDGSLAVLNAASTLSYRANLSTNGKRIVALTGEAYFEVAKDRAHPFIVNTANQQVQVLGTHFNVNSYPDEAAQKTTLLEGSVQVSSAGKFKLIAPGEQAVLADGEIIKKEVDVSQAVAWKNGLFNFESSDIQSAMRQFARWYNVEVVYEGPIPKDKIKGKVYRDADLADALLILKYMDIHYAVKGRVITIKS